MDNYKCRHHKDNDWVEIFEGSPLRAAEQYAEEYGVYDGSIVHIKRHGKYRVRVIPEYIYEAKKI